MVIVVDNTTELSNEEALKFVGQIMTKGKLNDEYAPVARTKVKNVWYTIRSWKTKKGYQFNVRLSLLQNV